MMSKAFLAGLVIVAVGAGVAVFRPDTTTAPVTVDRPALACDTCTARHLDKQRLRRELERLADSRKNDP